ncbi:MAG: SDR family oxidoreductase [Prosthecobacter sp.]|nr:SDR family oxidoreductase [Prosthecobacter sp.]
MQSPSKPLVVITGASSGIGAATAQAFSLAGYPLLLLARRLPEMEALNLPNTLCRQTDVLDRAAIKSAIAEAESRFGPVEFLINNAGIMLNGDPAQQSPEEWDQMIDVNLKGVMNGIHAVLPAMVAREGGTIVNIGSIAGRKTFGAHSVYCATKFGVHALTETIREEVSQKNVRLITIAPGMVGTDLIHHSTDEAAKAGWLDYAAKIGGALIPEDIAAAILYACQAPQRVCIREIVICPTKQEP